MLQPKPLGPCAVKVSLTKAEPGTLKPSHMEPSDSMARMGTSKAVIVSTSVLVTSSKALVTRSDALVPSSVLVPRRSSKARSPY